MNYASRYALVLSTVFALMPVATIEAWTPQDTSEKVDQPVQFRMYADIEAHPISIPTVFEVDVTDLANSNEIYGVFNVTDNTFEWSQLNKNKYTPTRKVTILSSTAEDPTVYMSDGNTTTFTNFLFSGVGVVETRIEVAYEKSISTDTLQLVLGANVTLPTSVAIYAKRGQSDEQRTLVAPTRMGGAVVRFPAHTAQYWTIVLTHAQPLRIAELSFSDNDAKIEGRPTVRFLAQPENEYRLYYESEGNRRMDYGRADKPNLNLNEGVVMVGHSEPEENPLFREGDSDGDGVPDVRDNCGFSNPLQTDVNENGVGDECDDFDRDGVFNSKDNCASEPNRDQKDTDEDGIGDECDQEESRFTEKHAWVPWIGIGFAALVILVLGVFALRTKPEEPTPSGSV